jgi:hypothetical protein
MVPSPIFWRKSGSIGCQLSDGGLVGTTVECVPVLNKVAGSAVTGVWDGIEVLVEGSTTATGFAFGITATIAGCGFDGGVGDIGVLRVW